MGTTYGTSLIDLERDYLEILKKMNGTTVSGVTILIDDLIAVAEKRLEEETKRTPCDCMRCYLLKF